MSYHSTWKIVFNTRGKAALVKKTLEDWVAKNQTVSYSTVIGLMLRHAIIIETLDILELADSAWRLTEWDSIIDTMFDLFDGDPEIEMASARIGDDYSDIQEFSTGFNTHLYINREIGDADLGDIPPAMLTDDETTETVVVNKEVCSCKMTAFGITHTSDCPEKKR